MHLIKDEILSLFAVIKCPLKDFKKKGMMMAYIKLKIVTEKLYCKVMYDCILTNTLSPLFLVVILLCFTLF